MNFITSKENSKIKDLIKLRDNQKFQNDKSLFYVEGERIIADTPSEIIEEIYVDEENVSTYKYRLDKIDDNKIYVLNTTVFSKIKDTINSQGIIATVKNNTLLHDLNDSLSKHKKILILDTVQDPGNLGTIIRVAEATGFDLVIMTNNCCSIYNTKVIRACMSSIFRLNTYISDNIISDINILKNNSYMIYASTLNEKSIMYNKIKYDDKVVIVVGNEGNGISKEIIDTADYMIKIPMLGHIESLNVAVATSIICYEVLNQRG